MEKPKDINEYYKWLKGKKRDITERVKTYYDSITVKMKNDFSKSDLWQNILNNMKEDDGRYEIETGYKLFFQQEQEPEILVKPFDSYVVKTFRKNIIDNDKWDDPPDGDWYFPDNCHSRINDILRTLFVVKYLDGVKYYLNIIRSYCSEKGLSCEYSFEAKEEGYYAAHLYVKHEFEIPKKDWDTEKINMMVEIQITTQLQEAIRKLLHKYYEENRKKIIKDENWQWEYKSDQFSLNYLGHILHYVEGMIVEIRERT
jgi:hypothetical protein